MSIGFLRHTFSGSHVAFWAETRFTRRKLPVEKWEEADLRLPNSKISADLRALLYLSEEEQAEPSRDGLALHVKHDAVVRLESYEVEKLGLPPRPPASLRASHRGRIEEEGFQFHIEFELDGGLHSSTYQRVGALLHLGGETYTLNEHLYRILRAYEAFGQASGDSKTDRLLAFGELKRAFPEWFDLGSRYLNDFQVDVAPSFVLRVKKNEKGEPDFDVEPCRFTYEDHAEGFEARRAPSFFLAPQHVARLFESFAIRDELFPAHPLGSGRLLIISEEARRAMQRALEIKKEPPEKRIAFLRDPHRYLQEAFDEDFDPERLDSLFLEQDLSDRIREIGIWQPRVLPWLRPAPSEWLPPVEVGLRIGHEDFEISPEELPDLQQKLQKALEEGEPTVSWNEHSIPATEEALRAVGQLLSRYEGKEIPEKQEQEDKELPPRVLLTHDNLEEVEYRARLRRQLATDSRVPSMLATDLLPHQREAVEWLQEHYAKGSPGALLADDMGLGKTLTTLAFLSWLRGLEQRQLAIRRPFLIVAPAGLLPNWQEEHDKHLFAPGLGTKLVAVREGIRELRKADGYDDPEWPVLDTKRLEAADWVLTTYETLRDYHASFAHVKWGALVLDEAQKVKNPASRMRNGVNSQSAIFRLALTGTPVENRMADLWSIADVAWPSRFGSLKDFCAHYEQASEAALRALSRALMIEAPPSFMKRRMKFDHLEGLPAKEVVAREREMPELQAKRYTEAVREARASRERGSMLAALHKLRKLSLAPQSLHEASSVEAWVEASARLSLLFEILDGIRAKGEKALVFLEERDVQKDLMEALRTRYRLPRPPMVINGAVASTKRQDMVNRFQTEEGFDVMLLSPKAAGTGLTLTAANHVIHLSRWWNPAVEDQCSDRVYRIGQEKSVFIHNLLAIHPEYEDASFDTILDNLLERKRTMSRNVLAPSISGNEADEIIGRILTGALS